MSRAPSSGAEPAATPIVVPVAPEHFQELRVRIPTNVHRQLLALKILRGVPLAETVTLALDRYFAQRGMAHDGETLASAKSA